MRKVALCAAVVALTALTSCKKIVNLAISNPTADNLNVVVTSLDDRNMSKGDNDLGSVSKDGGKATTQLTLKKNGGFQVTASLPSSAQVYQSTVSVAGQKSPLNKTIALDNTFTHIQTDGKELAGLFSSMGDNKGFTPRDLGNALKTLVGGIIIYSPPDTGKVEPNVHFSLSPAQLGNSEMDLTGFPFVQTDQSTDSDVERDTTTTVAASVPIYAQLSSNFSSSSLYKVHAELKGFGAVQKQDAANWNIDDALSKLSQAQKNRICAELENHKDAQMMYVNTVYALQLASFDYQEGQKVNAGVKAEGGSVVSGSVAYSFSNSGTKNFNVTSSALNFSGNSFTASDIPCAAWKAANTPPPPPPVAPEKPAPINHQEALLMLQKQHEQLMQFENAFNSSLNQKPAVIRASTRIVTVPASVLDAVKEK